jgi:hypothetical protein
MPREPQNYTATRWFNLKINDDIRIAYDGNNNPIYVGNAPPGTATNAKGWTIKKLTYDVNDNPTYIQSTSGSGNYTWDDRASYFP